ncbi:serine/threonine protein kinase [Flavobacterium cutihirudinis]|uniref:non-specific serine/threonine protein kinase n=1 Tax=Flavobacterium cutihirudinis TaxID=1265740 RepID=A0A3D9G162_9FLAO|nr:protein kinase [Flavobacterium cutihirudinis]RED26929.1 serine/threonine protein kinase [Flavobacterium cutihirudinis]
MRILKVIEVINQGGFGIIEKVICDDGNEYARKTFCPSSQFLSDKQLCDKLKARFIREVKTQKLLPKEYFIPIIYEDLESDNPWFLMPIAEDVYSNEIINSKAENRNPEGLGDILNSLEFIHSKGLVHRDLKPQNILKHEGIWKLADFGLISQDKEILSQTITTSNNAYGTVHYCAPEQTTEFRRVTPLADIYSFGAILHDIFTDGNRVPYSQLTANGEIGVIIEKCTKHKKEDRFINIATLRNKLLYVLSKQPILKSTVDNQWFEDFKNTQFWDVDKFESFVFFLKRNNALHYSFFYEINLEVIDNLFKIDKELFDEFCLMYFEWVCQTNYQFDYCDVIIGYILDIYNKTSDLEVKAKAAVTSAELAKSHNRWYVMRHVVKMSNKEINDDLAFRIVIEIDSKSRNKGNFQRCVEGINLNVTSYHDMIADLFN